MKELCLAAARLILLMVTDFRSGGMLFPGIGFRRVRKEKKMREVFELGRGKK